MNEEEKVLDEDEQIDDDIDSTLDKVTDEKEESGDVEPPLLDWKSVVKGMMNEDLVKNILIRFAETRTDIRQEMMAMASEDVTTRKLFVRGLAWSISDAELASAFESFGPIEEAVVVRVVLLYSFLSHSLTHTHNKQVRDKTTGNSKGFGFVTFKTISSAVNALSVTNKSSVIGGRT